MEAHSGAAGKRALKLCQGIHTGSLSKARECLFLHHQTETTGCVHLSQDYPPTCPPLALGTLALLFLALLPTQAWRGSREGTWSES